jgi:hypothetical protein
MNTTKALATGRLHGLKDVSMTIQSGRLTVVGRKGRELLITSSQKRRYIRNRLLSAGFGSVSVRVKQ